MTRAIGDDGLGRGVRSEQQVGEADDKIVGRHPQTLPAEKLSAVRITAEIAAARPYQQDVRIVGIGMSKAELLEFPGVRFENQTKPVFPQDSSSLLRLTRGECVTHGFDHVSKILETFDVRGNPVSSASDETAIEACGNQ
ncbi:hypothetical protein RE2895_50500 [Rhodococcus erythropolis]|nr:hypothetical protein RE2895_50500 [Rhodococcus erythropolis]